MGPGGGWFVGWCTRGLPWSGDRRGGPRRVRGGAVLAVLLDGEVGLDGLEVVDEVGGEFHGPGVAGTGDADLAGGGADVPGSAAADFGGGGASAIVLSLSEGADVGGIAAHESCDGEPLGGGAGLAGDGAGDLRAGLDGIDHESVSSVARRIRAWSRSAMGRVGPELYPLRGANPAWGG